MALNRHRERIRLQGLVEIASAAHNCAVSAMPLPKDATIETIQNELRHPAEWVRVVFGNMHQCKLIHGNANVRIGVTGDGGETGQRSPYYKICYLGIDDVEHLYGAYSGNSPTAFRDVAIHNNTWSTKSMEYQEVQQLLGALRRGGAR